MAHQRHALTLPITTGLCFKDLGARVLIGGAADLSSPRDSCAPSTAQRQ